MLPSHHWPPCCWSRWCRGLGRWRSRSWCSCPRPRWWGSAGGPPPPPCTAPASTRGACSRPWARTSSCKGFLFSSKPKSWSCKHDEPGHAPGFHFVEQILPLGQGPGPAVEALHDAAHERPPIARVGGGLWSGRACQRHRGVTSRVRGRQLQVPCSVFLFIWNAVSSGHSFMLENILNKD